MTSLEVFVHISTAYSNCDKQYIEEVIYPSPVEPQKIIDIIQLVIFVFLVARYCDFVVFTT